MPTANDKLTEMLHASRKGKMREMGVPLTNKKLNDPENQVARACKEWLAYRKVFGFQIKNLGTPIRTKDGIVGYRPVPLKGIADYIILVRGMAIFLEWKSAVGRQSDDQKEFARLVMNEGCRYFVIRGVDDMEKWVKPLL